MERGKKRLMRIVPTCPGFSLPSNLFWFQHKHILMQVSLSDDETETGLFASWFLENKNRASMAVVCPDSMSFVTDKSRETTTKSQWLNLAKAYQVIL